MKTPYKPAHGAGARSRAARAGTQDDGVARVEDPASGSGGLSLPDAVRARWSALGTTRRGRAIQGAAIVGATLVILGAMIAFARRPVPVPQLVGLTRAAATQRLTDAGLVLVVQGTALSENVAKGAVASQDPTAGVSLAKGSLVVVLISAGPGTFPLADLLGMTLDQATAALHDQGLVLEYGTEQSVSPSGTVIDSVPSAGDLVQSGDTIHLTLATNSTISIAEDLSGNSFVIDPEPPAYLSGRDVALDVANRLAGLLRMAGASVTLTRGALGSADMPGVSTRATLAQAADATAVVGFTIGTDSAGGIAVQAVPTGESSSAPGGSSVLADAIGIALMPDFSTVSTSSVSFDAVLSGANHPAARIRLGSSAVAADAASFNDPNWAQTVAHDVYAGLAALFGKAS